MKNGEEEWRLSVDDTNKQWEKLLHNHNQNRVIYIAILVAILIFMFIITHRLMYIFCQ